ncbi:DNA polymerase-3 subunit beta [Microbacterium sp. W4I4]|uniref:MerR family transcriptional regulator n=1 Tax=Microbacterium sp. W4I4 TaxID=3042295 RepID=UPI00278B09B0|nr:MerR family transcriptional regulator [Microbacterium sp. W4I4]MDQ0614152.1 DNA polymerase-3 subunit beta [Microbacterium sp. W4I4]
MDDFREPERGRQTLQMIGDFARAVGLSPSALREYGESGLIPPATVEERTGYRYYSLDQQQRGIWIRRLRDAGLRLDRIHEVLDGSPAVADAVLDDWLAESRQRTSSLSDLVDDLKLSLRAHAGEHPARRTSASFDAAVLASAMGQLGPSTGHDDAFDTVLVELHPHAATVASTDRFVLLARTDVPARVDGPPARVCLPVADTLTWLRGRRSAELILEQPVGREHRTRELHIALRDPDGGELGWDSPTDLFPDVHRIIAAAGPTGRRVAFARDDLRMLVDGADADSIRLVTDEARARLMIGRRTSHGTASGPDADLELSRSALARVVEVAAEGEITCDVGHQDEPLLWRSPRQPDFAAMMMPRMA